MQHHDLRYKEFQELNSLFLAQSSTVPDNIRQKLSYIASRIRQQPLDSLNKHQLPDITDLEQLPPKVLVIVFNSIAKSLFTGTRIPIHSSNLQNSCNSNVNHQINQNVELKCKVRFPGALIQIWKEGFVIFSSDKKQLTIGKIGKILRFDLCVNENRIQREKIVLQTQIQVMKIDSRTIVFMLKGRVVQLWARFDTKRQCRNFEEVYQKVNSQILAYAENQIKSKEKNVQIQSPSKNHLKHYQLEPQAKDTKIIEPFRQENFDLVEDKKNCRIRIHKSSPEVQIELKTRLKDSMEDIFSVLVNQKGWNTTIKLEEVVAKLDSNIYLIRRVYKPFSGWFSYERETLTLVEFERISQEKGILTEQTVQEQEIAELKSTKSTKYKTVKAQVKTVIMFQSMDENKGCRFLVQTSFKGNGYCTVSDNRQIVLQMYQDLHYFESHYLISKVKKDQQKKLFIIIHPSELSHDMEIVDSENQQDQQCKRPNSPGKQKDVQQMVVNRLSYKSSQMSESMITVQTDVTEETTRLRQILNFKRLRPLKPKYRPSQDYLDLLKRQPQQSSYLYSLEQNKLQERFDLSCKSLWDESQPEYSLEALIERGGQYQITEKKELLMINYKLIESQKGTLTFIIRQIGANLISGKSVMSISLPVDIFDSQSLMQRSAASFGYAPHYLQSIALCEPYQQMKNIFAFINSIPTLQLNMMKPFNPILGQTFQGYIKGIPIYYQQISHHPPISSYFMECEEFKLYGNLIAYADLGLNSAVGGNGGLMHIELKNGSCFECYFPPCEISGLIYGNRKFRAYGRGYILERQSKLLCEFSIQKEKKGVYQINTGTKLRSGDLIGGIFRVNDKFIQDFDSIKNVSKFNGLTKLHINQKLASIGGVWFEQLYVDRQPIHKGRAYPLEYHENVLPSDANYRLDILYHRIGNQSRSQQQKELLEEHQRADRRLRQKANKKRPFK